MKMPGLTQKAVQSHHSSSTSNPRHSGSAVNSRTGIWSRSNTNDVNLPQLRKFWSELPSAARHELLRIDKQTLFEQVRKNLYCSRCNGLLLEGYSQIFQYNKSLHEGVGCGTSTLGCNRNIYNRGSKIATIGTQDDARDPAVHPWGGLAATRDNMLTLLDCFLDDQPLEVIQNVFDCARAREWERELLYPDACGGGGRGWFSQGVGNSGLGRGHYFKETCALHTATLSCEALVDFWSALGEETRKSLLRMKEEDFIERLMFRFDRKQFCRDCRRNVLKEFKELKELKRTRREPRCTRSFCTPDTAFRYEVSNSSVQIDWKECFAGELGNVYHHFEWGIGSSEGKSDIFSFEDVGLCESARIDGLDFTSFSACFITLRAWKCDGRCTELSVKAYALKGQLCVHRRLVVGDGYISITKGDTIKCFFEHAEETEEEEDDDDDDDAMDKDGSGPDNDGSRLQKHAKSPELAREFLLDAANVIFKEQVEKAFREGTARQNAHSIFICLALNLLEDRIHVACKEITSLEKQNKLLEEEEDEKREEEERRERKKLKEKERKLRRKAKLKNKEHDKETNKEVEISSTASSGCSIRKGKTLSLDEEENNDSIDAFLSQPSSPDKMEAMQIAIGNASNKEINRGHGHTLPMDDIEDMWSLGEGDGIFVVEQSKTARRRSKMRKGPFVETMSKRLSRRSSLRVVEAGLHPRNTIQMPTASVIDLTTKTSCSSQYKSERNVIPRWIEVCNRRSQHKQDHQHCRFPNLENPARFKSRQNHIYRVGREFGSNKKIERSHKVLVGTKNSYRIGNGDPRPLQTRFEVMQHSGPKVSSIVKKGDVEQQLVTHSVTSYKSIKDVATSPQLMVTNSPSGSHMFSKDPTDSESSKTQGRNAEDLIFVNHGMSSLERSSLWLEEQSVQGASNLIEVGTPLSPSYGIGSVGSVSCQDPESFIYKQSNCRPDLISDGAQDVDSCSYSATSCITDASDSSCFENMISETTSCSEAVSSLPEGEMITQSLFMTENLPDAYKRESCIIERSLEVPVTSKSVRETASGNPLTDKNISTLESDEFSNMTEHANGLPNNHGPDAANSTYSPVDTVPPFCHVAFPMQILGTPSSLLPLLPPQHFGCYQIQEQWAAPVSTHLLHFPLPSGLDLSTNGLTTPSNPFPSPFQPYPTLKGLGHLPEISTDLSFIPQDSHGLCGIGHMDPTSSRYADGLEYLGSETVVTGNESFSHEFSISMDATCDSSSSDLKSNALDASKFNSSGFSFFHFGGSIASGIEDQGHSVPGIHEEVGDDLGIPNMPCKSLQVAKLAIPVEEYNLFATVPGNRFGFF